MENAAVEFDAESLQPTYRLHYGIPGASHAFTIARRIGLPDKVLSAAEDYLGLGEREGVAIIERLQTLRATLDEELRSARQLGAAAEEDRRHSRQERREVAARRQAILEEARQRGIDMLAAAEEKLQALFRQVPAGAVPSRERAALTSSLRELHEVLPEPLPQGPQQVPAEVAVREILYVPELGIEAEVTRIDGDRLELLAGGKKLRQARSALRQFQPRRFAEQHRPVPRIRDRVERRVFCRAWSWSAGGLRRPRSCSGGSWMKPCCTAKCSWRLSTVPVRASCAMPSGSFSLNAVKWPSSRLPGPSRAVTM